VLISFVLLFFFLLCFTGCSREPPVNIILLAIDTLRWDRVGIIREYGYSLTPEIDKFTHECVKFESVTSTSPWTLPSFGSILTGVYPEIHGASGSFTGNFGSIQRGLPTLPELLSEHGYKTCAIVNGPFLSPIFGFARGFEVYDFFEGNNYNMRKAEEVVGKGMSWISSEILVSEPSRPFFLFLHFFDPHLNYDPPEDFMLETSRLYGGDLRMPFDRLGDIRTGGLKVDEADKGFIRSLYDGEVGYVDYQIGSFIEFLEENGVIENCLIIITSDHGEEFWEHGGFEHGHTLFEELVHVPLLMKFPGGRYGGETVAEPVSLVDIFPTVLEVAGCESVKLSQGRSLSPLIIGSLSGERPVFSGSTLYKDGRRSIRLGSMKYISSAIGTEKTLFDLETDPRELLDLSQDQPELIKRFESELNHFDSLSNQLVSERTGMSSDRSVRDSVHVEGELLESLRSLGYVQ